MNDEQTAPKHVFVIKYCDGSYYNYKGIDTLPAIYASYAKAKGVINARISGLYMPEIVMWEITEISPKASQLINRMCLLNTP